MFTILPNTKEMAKNFLKFCQSGKISPNLVTLTRRHVRSHRLIFVQFDALSILGKCRSSVGLTLWLTKNQPGVKTRFVTTTTSTTFLSSHCWDESLKLIEISRNRKWIYLTWTGAKAGIIVSSVTRWLDHFLNSGLFKTIKIWTIA